MRTTSVLLLLLLFATQVSAGITYRWVDGDGVHYSDQPHQGAEKIMLGPAPTASASSSDAAPGTLTGRTSPGTPAKRASDAPFQYSSCAVVQPADDQVLIDIESLTVAVEPHPTKRANDHVVLSFDGTATEAATADQLEFHITPVDRGTHTVAAELRDSNNKSVCKSAPVKFHVRQPSVYGPANPLRKH
jgi:Domain of unknown function (DUF4124)